MSKIIYLDQNKWIQLAWYYTQRDTNNYEIKKVLELAKFMGSVSRNWGISPYGVNKEYELWSNLKEDNKYSPIKYNQTCLFGKLCNPRDMLKKCGVNLLENQDKKINEFIAKFNFFSAFHGV